jgi:predicted TIM-barrel fold metal-dependent hydrolase
MSEPIRDPGRAAQDILAMRPLSCFVFDCHAHVGAVGTMRVHDAGSVGALIGMMDLVGIDRAAFSHMLAISGDVIEGNRLGREAARSHPGRLSQYLVWDPNLPAAAMRADLERSLDEPTTAGVKLHPMWHGAMPDDPRYDEALEMAGGRSMPVLVHTWGTGEVRACERLARRHPDAPVLIGHSGGSELAAIDEAVRAAAENENLYLDLTMSIAYDGIVERMLAKAPAERILFGTDMAYIDPRSLAGRLAFARIGDDVREMIFGKNFEALLRRVRRGRTPPRSR